MSAFIDIDGSQVMAGSPDLEYLAQMELEHGDVNQLNSLRKIASLKPGVRYCFGAEFDITDTINRASAALTAAEQGNWANAKEIFGKVTVISVTAGAASPTHGLNSLWTQMEKVRPLLK